MASLDLPSRRRKRVLVTGGAGFLGSHLCDRLVEQGHDVLCCDNFYTGDKTNIQHLLQHPRFEMLRHDITFPLYVEVDEIYNLASAASPIYYQKDPVQTTKTSVSGTINILGLAKRVGARVVQASTSEVYGDPEVHPQPESYRGHVNPLGPRACYDEGKRCAETLCSDYQRQHELDVRIARIFNTYGPRMQPDDGRVVSTFIVQALYNAELTVFGDGGQTRSLCYVDDLIAGLMKLMAAPEPLDRPVNLGNPGELSMAALAQKIVGAAGSQAPITYKPLPEDDPARRCPDITRAREVLGWAPTTDIDHGLATTIAWFAQIFGWPAGAGGAA